MAKILQFFLLLTLLSPIQRAKASPLASASELIAEVNALRASYGLSAYQTDSGLMAYAQEHADYCASLGHGTHQHSDGSYPSDIGLVENVAEGSEGYVTIELAVYTIWSDSVHMNTMTGYTSGQVGAGMAVKGGTVYYVLNVRGGEQAQITPQTTSTATPATQAPTSDLAIGSATPADYTFVPVLTNTPQADGSIVHIVQSGDTLWSIALSYGVKVEELRWLNGMESDSNEIYLEQSLLIRPAYTPTPTGALTDTPSPSRQQATRTATPSPSLTPLPSSPAVASSTEIVVSPTAIPAQPFINRLDLKSLGIGALAGILILVAVAANEVRRLRKR